jgi:hypothetical protein
MGGQPVMMMIVMGGQPVMMMIVMGGQPVMMMIVMQYVSCKYTLFDNLESPFE